MFNHRLNRRKLIYSTLGVSAIASVLAAKRRYPSRDRQFAMIEDERAKRLRDRTVGLKQPASAKGLIYGAFPEANHEQASQDLEFQSSLVRECRLLAAGEVWSGIYPSLETPNFSKVDYFQQFARDRQLLFKLDAAVWHEFLPPWLMNKFADSQTTATEIADILRRMVQTIGKRYADGAYAWSVINEVINTKDGRGDGLRDTKISGSMAGKKYASWLHFLDSDYIEITFKAAAEVAPQTTLIYNDFGLEYDTPEEEAKRTAVLKMLERLKRRGTPVHALGVQAHLNASLNEKFNPTKYRQFLRDVADLGLKIQVTELDVADNWLPIGLDLATRDRIIAKAYYDYLTTVLQEPEVDTVVTWGLSDRYTWLDWFAPRKDGAAVRPLPLDRQLNRKLAWNAIFEAFEAAPRR